MFFIFIPTWEHDPIWRAYFFKWVGIPSPQNGSFQQALIGFELNPPKISIDTQNDGFWNVFPFKYGCFGYPMLNSRGCCRFLPSSFFFVVSGMIPCCEPAAAHGCITTNDRYFYEFLPNRRSNGKKRPGIPGCLRCKKGIINSPVLPRICRGLESTMNMWGNPYETTKFQWKVRPVFVSGKSQLNNEGVFLSKTLTANGQSGNRVTTGW